MRFPQNQCHIQQRTEVEESKETGEGSEKGQLNRFDFYLGGTTTIGEQSTAVVESRVKGDKRNSKSQPMFSLLWITIKMRGLEFGKIIHDLALHQKS